MISILFLLDQLLPSTLCRTILSMSNGIGHLRHIEALSINGEYAVTRNVSSNNSFYSKSNSSTYTLHLLQYGYAQKFSMIQLTNTPRRIYQRFYIFPSHNIILVTSFLSSNYPYANVYYLTIQIFDMSTGMLNHSYTKYELWEKKIHPHTVYMMNQNVCIYFFDSTRNYLWIRNEKTSTICPNVQYTWSIDVPIGILYNDVLHVTDSSVNPDTDARAYFQKDAIKFESISISNYTFLILQDYPVVEEEKQVTRKDRLVPYFSARRIVLRMDLLKLFVAFQLRSKPTIQIVVFDLNKLPFQVVFRAQCPIESCFEAYKYKMRVNRSGMRVLLAGSSIQSIERTHS